MSEATDDVRHCGGCFKPWNGEGPTCIPCLYRRLNRAEMVIRLLTFLVGEEKLAQAEMLANWLP